MSTASSPRREAFHWLRALAQPLLSRPPQANFERPAEAQANAARMALLQAESPTERIHALYQAQSAGVPLHEIEERLDWADARAAAGIK